jgi:DDE superfamily endonuclease
VHAGQLVGRCERKTGIAPFERLVADLMAREPYASARTVYMVCDNGSSHRGQASIDRTAEKWPNVLLVHLPVHASWLNQIEIVFSILQRKVLSPNDLTDPGELAERIEAFEHRFNDEAHPFGWRFTRADLDALLKRLAAHDDAPTAVA